MANLSVKYMGMTLKNPIVVASSRLASSEKSVKKCADSGVGAIVLKSIFEEQIIAESRKITDASDLNIHPEAWDYIMQSNSEKEIDDYLRLIDFAKKETDIPVIASINCSTDKGWTDFTKRIENAGADGIELNLFILPTDYKKSGEEIESLYFRIVEKVTSKVSIPVALKIGAYFTNPIRMVYKLSKTPVSAIVIFNRFYRPDIDVENLSLVPSRIYSSPHEIAGPLRWIALLSGDVECDIAGSTGAHSGLDVVKFILAGASVAQVCSTLYINGLEHVGVMLDEISGWMERHKVGSLDEIRGKMSQANMDNPVSYERVQFMKAITFDKDDQPEVF
jgi:dihydroorotate dehydrogenase (fumarate)